MPTEDTTGSTQSAADGAVPVGGERADATQASGGSADAGSGNKAPARHDSGADDPGSAGVGTLEHLASQASLQAEADELVAELHATLDQARKRFDGDDAQPSDDEWRRQLRTTQSRLWDLFQRWDWNQTLLSDPEVSSVLRTCALPDVDLAGDDGLENTEAHLLWVIQEKEESAALLRTLHDLDDQLSDRRNAAFQPLRDAALARYIDMRYGQRRFIERLEHTLTIGRRLLNLVPALMAAATLGAASAQPGATDLGDFAALALARLHAAVEHYEELHVRCAAAESELNDEKSRVRDAGAVLMDKNTELIALASHAETLGEERDRIQARLDHLEEENGRLAQDVKEAHDEAARLRRKIARMETQAAAAPTWTDSLLSQLYQFTWKHGRVAGDAGLWYSLLRAAAVDDPSEAPAGVTTMISSNNNTADWPAAPAMTGLTNFRSIDGAKTLVHASQALPSERLGKSLKPVSLTPLKRDRTLDLTHSDDEADSDLEDTRKHTPRREVKGRSRGLVKAQLRQGEDSSASSSDDGSGSGGSDVTEDDDDKLASAARGKKAKKDDPIVTARPGFVQTCLRRSLYDGCVAVPARLAGEPPTDIQFPKVPHPFVLGSVRGRSSTIPYADMSRRQREVVNGITTQAIFGEATSFHPNYRPTMTGMKLVMTRLDTSGLQKYQEFLATKPWDAMWAGRVKHFFLFDPNQCSAPQVAWLQKMFLFMYEYREAFWTIRHWLAISKTDDDDLYPDWYEMHRARAQYTAQFRARAQTLIDDRPLGMTDMVWSEPAIWMASTSCSWIPADPALGKTFMQEVAGLDKLEPIRARWSTTPGRFVEALLPEHLDLLDQHVDADGTPHCWAIPAPYDSSDPDVFEAMAPTSSFTDFARRIEERRLARSKPKGSVAKSGKSTKAKAKLARKSKKRRLSHGS